MNRLLYTTKQGVYEVHIAISDYMETMLCISVNRIVGERVSHGREYWVGDMVDVMEEIADIIRAIEVGVV